VHTSSGKNCTVENPCEIKIWVASNKTIKCPDCQAKEAAGSSSHKEGDEGGQSGGKKLDLDGGKEKGAWVRSKSKSQLQRGILKKSGDNSGGGQELE
jgi:hypothetical protein